MNDKVNGFLKEIEENLYRFFENRPYKEYKQLFYSMEYSLKNGGKRVRPLLTMLFCDACNGDTKKAIPLAEAVEFIHTYSLIHDDLPCMDNDDFRRGNPSNHKVYGEDTALLAGDGLLTAAFERISTYALSGLYDYETAVKAIYELSVLSGAKGMIGGQIIDLTNENNSEATFETLELMDNLKTGALISASAVLGCIAAKADAELINSARIFGQKLGLAFQIKDDVLDVTSTFQKLGKLTGSDEENSKATYVSLLGVEECQKLVEKLTDEALSVLDDFPNSEALKEYAHSLAYREN